MSKKPRLETDGARALRRYLDTNGLSITRFCEEHELDRIMVQRALNGERVRFSVDFAAAIERATVGAVAVALWQSSTARPAAPPRALRHARYSGRPMRPRPEV